MQKRLLTLLAALFVISVGYAVRPDAVEIEHRVHQTLLNSRAAKSGAVLYRQNPNALSAYGQHAQKNALEAWLQGQGPMTPEVRRMLKGKVITSLPDIQGQLASAPGISKEETSIMVMPTATVHPPTKEGADDVFDLSTIILAKLPINPVTLKPDGNYGYIDVMDFDIESEGWWNIAEGNYNAYLMCYVFDSEDNFKYIAVLEKTVTITEENPHFDLYMDDIKHVIRCQNYNPQGEEVPDGLDVDAYHFFIPETEIIANTCGGMITMSLIGTGSGVEIHCSDLDEFSQVLSISSVFQDTRENTTPEYIGMAVEFGPFTEDCIVKTDIEAYKEVSATFSLTEKEKERMCSSSGASYDYQFPNAFSLGGIGGWINTDLHPAETASHLISIPRIEATMPEGKWDRGYQFFTQTLWDEENYMAQYKVTPIYTPVGDDTILYPMGQYANEENIYSYSYTYCPSPLKIYEVPEKYFLQSLYATPVVGLFLSGADQSTILAVMGSYDIKGPFNEYIKVGNIWDYLKEVRCNGEVISIDDLMGSQSADNTYEFDFEYDDILVNEEFATTNLSTVGLKPGSSDSLAPSFSFYQVRNNEGTITNLLEPNEGSLYVCGKDYGVCSYKVEIAPMQSDDFVELEGVLVENSISAGEVYQYDLSGIEPSSGTWYKTRIEMTDESGNFVRQTINYCFRVGKSSGVERVNEVDAKETGNIFYDLNGHKVLNPIKGLYLRSSGQGYQKVIVR